MLDFMVWLLGDFVLGLSENLAFFQLESRILKRLVHPKMKIKSLITHPHAVPTP